MARRQPLPPSSAPLNQPTTVSTWLTLIVLGIAVRVAIAAISWGTNDSVGFWSFGITVNSAGLFEAYRRIAELNHPPIPALWSAVAAWMATALGGEIPLFTFIFKLPAIAADAISAWLLYRIGSRRPDGKGWPVAAMYAWALAPMLVSGYHANTDTIYAMLSLLAVWLLEDRKRPLAAGLALTAAINIKLIPILLIPPLLLSLGNWREMLRFTLGLAVGVLPFVPVLINLGEVFVQNALGYSPKPDRWGLMLPLLWNRDLPLDPVADHLVLVYKWWGRFVILGLVAAWSLLARWRGTYNRYDIAAVTYAIFLVFTSGFGAQYTALIVPLLIAARPLLGFAYSSAAGLAILLLYYLTWEGEVPLTSLVLGYLPHAAAAVGVIAWLYLVAYLVVAVKGASRSSTAS